MTTNGYRYHEEETIHVPAKGDEVFAFVDDHRNLAGHMNERQGMMMGSALTTTIDEKHGQEIGSHIQMGGRVLGVRVELDETITERTAPTHKAWETVSEPTLLVIGGYRMGFDVTPDAGGTNVRVFIDYNEPTRNAWMAKLFGKTYAKWCVREMTGDVAKHFDTAGPRT